MLGRPIIHYLPDGLSAVLEGIEVPLDVQARWSEACRRMNLYSDGESSRGVLAAIGHRFPDLSAEGRAEPSLGV